MGLNLSLALKQKTIIDDVVYLSIFQFLALKLNIVPSHHWTENLNISFFETLKSLVSLKQAYLGQLFLFSLLLPQV